MFDNLKEKLGAFRKEAEEAAEENVEPIDDDDDAIEDAEVAEGSEDAEVAEAVEDVDGVEDAEVTEGVDSINDIEGSEDVKDGGDERSSADEPAERTSIERDITGSEIGDTSDHEQPESSLGSGQRGEKPSATPDDLGEPTESIDDTNSESDSSTSSTDDASEAEPSTDESANRSDESNGTGFGRRAKSLIRGKFVIDEDDLEGPLEELELALLTSDVELSVAEEILDNIRSELIGETRTVTTSTGAVVESALRDAIYDVISVGQFDFDERIASEATPVVIIFTGVNGVGKTTSIAKLSRYLEQRGFSTVLANGDTFRAGANEQIREHADNLDTKLISHEQGGDPAAVLYDAVEYAEANDVDIVLGDTAGRLHTNQDLMAQLEKIDRVVGPDLTVFVDEAVAGQDAVKRAKQFDEAASIDGAILTKADADSNGGAAISIAHVTGKPILFLGVGQGYDDLEPFDPDEMADRLLGEE